MTRIACARFPRLTLVAARQRRQILLDLAIGSLLAAGASLAFLGA